MAQLSNETKKRLRELAEKQATEIAQEFKDKMCEKYEGILDAYYSEPYETKPPHYERTWNLRRSYMPCLDVYGSKVIGGIDIGGMHMDDYGKRNTITGERYLEKYFFNPSATWHGGDWHGGYGVMAKFSAYTDMVDYYKKTVKEFQKKYGI